MIHSPYTGGSHSIAGSENLKSVVIPDTVKIIGDCSFRDCVNLNNIEIPSSVIEIGSYAFEMDTGLKTIRIPESVQTINYSAFSGCYNLKTIIVVRNGDETLEGAPWGAENANVIYVEADYEKFANDFIKNKTQDELEELVLKTTGFLGTFDEYLQEEVQMTRDEFEQMGTEYYGMTYLDALKFSLVYAMGEGSWIQVEYQVNLNGGSGKTVEELEELFWEKLDETGKREEFEKMLQEEGITVEQFFEQMCQSEGLRTKEDLLKIILYLN